MKYEFSDPFALNLSKGSPVLGRLRQAQPERENQDFIGPEQ
jgi:hypothetical protein